MKKLLCVVLSLVLITTSSVFMVYASKGGDKTKKAIDKNTTQTQDVDTEDEVSTSDSKDAKVAKDKSVKASIETLKEQFKEVHKDKEKRKEILKQIAQTRLENKQKGSPVFIDGNLLETDVPPVVKAGRTLIPLRAIANGLKANVEWDPQTKTVTITKDNTVIVVTLGSNIATVNGQEVKIEVPAESISNRTMVPIRFISEIFKKSVDYDKETGSVIIEEGGETPTPSATSEASVTPEVAQTPAPEATAEVIATPTPEATAEVIVTPAPSEESSPEASVTPDPTAAPEPAL